MDETLRRALYDFGTLVKVYAFLPALSIVVAIAWGEHYAIPTFALTAALAAGFGLGLEAVFDAPEDVDGLAADSVHARSTMTMAAVIVYLCVIPGYVGYRVRVWDGASEGDIDGEASDETASESGGSH